jgi:hypothetical protein
MPVPIRRAREGDDRPVGAENGRSQIYAGRTATGARQMSSSEVPR